MWLSAYCKPGSDDGGTIPSREKKGGSHDSICLSGSGVGKTGQRKMRRGEEKVNDVLWTETRRGHTVSVQCS